MLARFVAGRKPLLQKSAACTLLLHRDLRFLKANPSLDLVRGFSSQKDFEPSPDFGNYGFDRPEVISWHTDICSTVELLGKLGQDVRLLDTAGGYPIAKTFLKVGEGGVWLPLEFVNDLALVAAAYLVKNDCILVSGRLYCVVQDSNWKIKVDDVKYVQTEQHEGNTCGGFVRGPRMQNLIGESSQALWMEYFRDPCQWWDIRVDKQKNSSPDFRHKTTNKTLWIKGYNTPKWVEAWLQREDAKRPCGSDSKPSKEACQDDGKPCQHKEKPHRHDGKPSSLHHRHRLRDIAAHADRLWQDLFVNPSDWWDQRTKKKNPRAPDFKHKTTRESLWISSWETPPWVMPQLAALDLNVQTGEGRRQDEPSE